MTVRSADALRSIGALLRARVASHSAHPSTRSFPHGPPFHARDGICSHRPPHPWIVPAGVLRQRTPAPAIRSEEHTSELQSPCNLVCRLLLEKKKTVKHLIAHILTPLTVITRIPHS